VDVTVGCCDGVGVDVTFVGLPAFGFVDDDAAAVRLSSSEEYGSSSVDDDICLFWQFRQIYLFFSPKQHFFI
jgi:hypothetical protein